MAAPKLLAGLIPVPVMGMVARWTKNTAKPMGRGAKSYEKQKIKFREGISFICHVQESFGTKENIVQNIGV